LSADASTFMVEMAEAACFLKDATPDRYAKSE
jgi:DNA mismatch repair ATPase MutS